MSSLNIIAGYSIMNEEYPKQLDKLVAYIELVSSLGYIFGPLLVSMLYTATSGPVALSIYGALIVISSLPLYFMQFTEVVQEHKENQTVYLSLLKHPVLCT
mmetsp:Transcript_6255/g.10848  ORF Transcript_6255/g.10848 Transcript_6255/m.10848 type:complete len:101 (+) Transcript_6255:217-519(+)